MTRRHRKLDGRAAVVMDLFLSGRKEGLHPEDLQEAEWFWHRLGEFDAPELPQAAARSRTHHLFRAAACLMLAVTLGLALYLARDSAPRPAEAETYASGHGEIDEIELADNSKVVLGAETQIVTQFLSAERRVKLLSGEALFEVAKDTQRPFIVETERGEVRAVGTAFVVRIDATGDRLTVVEGRVKVSPKVSSASKIRISRLADAGEQLVFGQSSFTGTAPAGFISKSVRVDSSRAVQWAHGTLVFNGEPLVDVIRTVNRYADRPVELRDASAADLPVYAVVNIGDSSAIRQLIEDIEKEDGGAAARMSASRQRR